MAPQHELPSFLASGRPCSGSWPASPGFRLAVRLFDRFARRAIGAALLATGTALAIKGHIDRSSLQSSCAPFCSEEAIDSVRTTWWVAGGLATAGGIGLGISALLWPRTLGNQGASLGLGPRSVALHVRFP